MTNDYTYLDAAIISGIKELQPISFNGLLNDHFVMRESLSLEVNQRLPRFTSDRKPAWRFVDARLQALRKAGKSSISASPKAG